jgi:hypothetical protein
MTEKSTLKEVFIIKFKFRLHETFCNFEEYKKIQGLE